MAGSIGFATIGVERACLANADFDSSIRHPFMTDEQRTSIKTIAEIIIPKTETAGAIDAAVPEFIELMLSDWYTADERQPLIDGLEHLGAECMKRYLNSFLSCSGERQIEVLSDLQDEPFFKMLKSLTVYGYYTSEIGIEAELQLNMAPGRYTTINFSEVSRQWAS